MKCVICKYGETKPGLATVNLSKNGSIIVIKEVPAEICQQCGEYYLNEKVTELITQLTETAILKNTKIQVLRYTA